MTVGIDTTNYFNNISHGYSRVTDHMWTKAKTRWQRTVLRVNVFVEDYSVELQTAAVIAAGVVAGVVIKKEINKVADELKTTNREIQGLHAELTFFNDDLAAARWNDQNEKRILKDTILRAREDGRPFEYFAGLGVLFQTPEDNI